MTRLERDDPYLRTFDSVLEGVRDDADGTWWRLRESAFYATGGGQPHDEGTLHVEGAAAWRVTGVESDDDGTVWHRVAGDAEAPPVGTAVGGVVDWPRRWRHMQRHTAQHLVSQAFVRVDPAFATRSVALGSPEVTVDLAGEPDDEAVAAAVRLANEVAAEALPIAAFEVDERDLGSYPLRRPPKVSGRVRLVRMGDWELSACGGTHLRSTAEALPLLLLARERIRGGLVRVTFRAGAEAIEHAHATQAAAAGAAQALSSAVAELPERVRALLAEASTARRELAHARAQLADARVAALAPAPGGVVALALAPDEAALAADLAAAVAAVGASAVVGAAQGDKAQLFLASGDGVDVRPALRAGLALLDGRGGGRPERAQGAGPRLDALADAVAAAHALLTARPGNDA
jgi:alanyl-tRNA synthetase